MTFIFEQFLEGLKVGNGALKKNHEVEVLMKWEGFRKKQQKECVILQSDLL
jgi:hypothetical protein